MSTVAELLVKISGDSSGLRKELAASQRQMKRAFGADALSFSGNLASGMGLVGAAIGGVGVAAVKMAADMEQNRIAFTTMLGSASAAESFLKNLATFAEKTPFEFTGLVDSSKKLLAYGYTAQEIIPMISSIGDAVAAVGGSAEVLDRVTLAFGQMKAKGFVSGEEMRQLAEAGIPAWQMLANVIGKTIPETMKLAEDKALNANAAIAGMISQMGEKYGGMMEKQSGTITGILSNIKDKSGAIMRTLGDEIVEALDLKAKMQGALTFLDGFAARVKASGVRQAIADLIPPELELAIYAVAGAITMALIPSLYGLALAAIAALAPLWPLLAIGAAIGAAFYVVQEAQKQLKDSSDALIASVDAECEGLSQEEAAALKAATGYNDLAAAKRNAANVSAWEKGVQEHRRPGDGSFLDSAAPSGAPMITGGSGGGGKSEFEKLQDEAKRTSEAIEREWASTTKTQLEQLDRWQTEQLEDLAKSADANENYERDKERVAATYSVRRQKILQDESIATLNTFKSIRDGYQDIMSGMAGLKGSSKDVSDINKTYDDKAKAAGDYFEKISQDYLTGTEAQKQAIITALNAQNIAYQVSADGKLNLDKAAADASASYQKQKLDELNTYYRSAKDIQSQIDEAYRQNSMAKLQEALTAENAIRMNDYTAQQSMMQTYQEAFLAAHTTTADLIAGLYEGAFSGLKNVFSGIITGSKTASDAVLGLGQCLLQVVADYVAKWLAGRIMMAIFGKTATATEAAVSMAAGAATASAWAPAAAMVSLATMGANSVPAMAGMAATTAMATMLSIPKLANGAITTGPSLAMIGEGRYQEAVIPLNNRSFSKISDGIAGQSAGGQTVFSPTFQINAIDGKSFEKWLNNGGGKKISKFFGQQAANFEVVTT